MKTLILAPFFFFLSICACFCQSTPQTTADSVQLVKSATLTTERHTTKAGKSFQVFTGSKGGKFIVRKSGKSGKWYKSYLPKETATKPDEGRRS